jgi:ubiquinone biosynthesis protein Coq4
MSSHLFVSKYQLYLPNKEGLRALPNNQLEYLSLEQIEDNKKTSKTKTEKTKKQEYKFVRHCLTNYRTKPIEVKSPLNFSSHWLEK